VPYRKVYAAAQSHAAIEVEHPNCGKLPFELEFYSGDSMPKAALVALIFASICRAQASIAGSVTTTMGDPVKGATLRLTLQREAPGQEVYSVFSDAKGNFIFQDLAPGSYYLCSDKPGYLYKCHADSAGRNLFDLASGQKLTGIDIRMTPQAVISGRIVDENGDPLSNFRVETARWSYGKGGRQLAAGGGGSASNVEGEFSIGRLEAGSYYLQAQPISASQNIIPKGPQEAYLSTYYPGVSDPSKAIAVQVPAGGTVRGIEIRMNRTRAYRVRGVVSGFPSEAAPLGVQLTPEAPVLLRKLSTIVRNGAFDIEGVPPGVYFLDARSRSGFARQKVAVGGADVDDVVLQFAPFIEITGTISIDGVPAMNVHPTVQLISTEGTGATSPPANGDGTFMVGNLMPAAMYRVNLVQPLPPGTYVKSVRFGDQDVTKAPFRLTAGDSGTLNIVLSPNAGEIVATVHDADGLIRPSVYVSLWTPGLPAEGAPDFTKIEVNDRDGKVKFTNLPPGEYRIAAWEGGDQILYQAMLPEVRIKLDSKGAAVKLDEGGRASIDAPLIAPDIVEAEIAKLP
jgi:hypothetical protein